MSKETLNLPKTAFSMKANLPNKEPAIIKQWEDKAPSIIPGIRGSIEHFNEWKIALDFMINTHLKPRVVEEKNNIIIHSRIISKSPKMVIVRLVQLLTDYQNELWSKHQIQMLNQFIKTIEIL